MRLSWFASSAALLALCGCDQILGIEGGTESPWFCSAHVAVPSGKNSYEFHFVNAQLQPYTPPSVSLCATSDPTCASAKKLMLGSSTLHLKLDATNDGFLSIPGSINNASTLVELGPAGDVVPTERIFPLFNLLQVLGLNQDVGVTPNDADGGLIVAAYDCNEMPAEGVSIAVTIDGRPASSDSFYIGPDYKTVVKGAATSSTGLGFVTNVAPSDAATVTVTRASDQVVVATALVHVRAQALTELYLGPTKTE